MPSEERNNRSAISCNRCTDERYAQILLPCLHCFCSECFSRSSSSNQQPEPSVNGCPECGEKSSMNGNFARELFQPDILGEKIVDINEFLRQPVGHRSCSGCPTTTEDGSVCAYCLDCQEFFCQHCTSIHRNFSFAAAHRLLQRDEIEGRRLHDLVRDTCRFCEVHRDAEELFYCYDCEVPVCEACYAEQHADCQCVFPVNHAVLKEDMCAVLEQYLDTMEHQIEKGNELLIALEWEAEKLLMETKSVRLSLDLREKLAKDTVSHFAQALHDELDQHSAESFAAVDSIIKDVGRELEELQVHSTAMRNCVEISAPADIVLMGSNGISREIAEEKNDFLNWRIDPTTLEPSMEIENIFAKEKIGEIFGRPEELGVGFDRNSFLEYKESLVRRRSASIEKNAKEQQQRIIKADFNNKAVKKNHEMQDTEIFNELYDINPESSTPGDENWEPSFNTELTRLETGSSRYTVDIPDHNKNSSLLQSTADSGFFSPEVSRQLKFSPVSRVFEPNGGNENSDIHGFSKESNIKAMMGKFSPDANEFTESKLDSGDISCSLSQEFKLPEADSSGGEVTSNSDSLSFHTTRTSMSASSLDEEKNTAIEAPGMSEITWESADSWLRNGEEEWKTIYGSEDKIPMEEVDEEDAEIKEKPKSRRKMKTKKTRNRTKKKTNEFTEQKSVDLNEIQEKENPLSVSQTRQPLEDNGNRQPHEVPTEPSVRNRTDEIVETDGVNTDLPADSKFKFIFQQQPSLWRPQNLEPSTNDSHPVAQENAGISLGVPALLFNQTSASQCVPSEYHTNGNFTWKYPNGNRVLDFSGLSPHFEPSVPDNQHVLESHQQDFASLSPIGTQYSGSTRDLRSKVPKTYNVETTPLPSELPYDSEQKTIFCYEGEVCDGNERLAKGMVKVVIPKDGLPPTVQLEWEEELCSIRSSVGKSLFKRLDQSKVVLPPKGTESSIVALDFETKRKADQFEDNIFHLIDRLTDLQIH